MNRFFLLITLLSLCSLMACNDDEPAPPFELLASDNPPGSFTTDVWGFQMNDKEYAVTGDIDADNLYIYDVTGGSSQLISTVEYSAFDMKVWQNYLYVVNGHRDHTVEEEGIVFDISDPTAPDSVGSFPSSHNIFIDDKGYLYLADRANFSGDPYGISILDLNGDPTDPELVWTSDLSPSHDLTVVGDRMYDFHKTKGTNIYDVTDRSSPILLSTIDPAIVTFDHSGWPTKDGNYLFVADEFGDTEAVETKLEGPDISIYDISNLSAPVKVGEIHDDDSRAHNIYIIGDIAYVSYYAAGFRVYNISDPSTPSEIYTYDMNGPDPIPDADGFEGAFGVYPFSPSGNIYVSDINEGLFVFRQNL